MTALSQVLAEDRRLVVLRMLRGTPGCALNEFVLQELLKQHGHTMSRDKVRTELEWLSEQELITIEAVDGRLLIATITERGADVSTGMARTPGVKVPAPGSG